VSSTSWVVVVGVQRARQSPYARQGSDENIPKSVWLWVPLMVPEYSVLHTLNHVLRL
jgi:hypothetical protein